MNVRWRARWAVMCGLCTGILPAATASTGVNVAPVVIGPASRAISEDTPAAFTGSNQISVSDVDATAGTVFTTTITATLASVSVSPTTGLTFSAGANGSSTMTFSSNLSALNASLGGIVFTPATNFSGLGAQLNISVSDGELTGTHTIPISVSAVNDAPVATVPGTQVATEDSLLTLSGANALRVSDIDAASLTVTLSVAAGNVSLGGGLAGLSFSAGDGTNDATMTFSGSIANLLTALSIVSFNPQTNSTASTTLTLSANDNGQSGAGGALTGSNTLVINISGVNDAPAISAPASRTANEDTALTFTGADQISVSDIDATGGATFTTTITVTNATTTVASTSGLSFVSGANGTASMSFTSNLIALNTALAGLSVLPIANYNGAAQLFVVVSDGGSSGSGGTQATSRTIPLNVAAVNDAPTLTAPTLQIVTEDVPSSLSGFAVADIDAVNLQLSLTLPTGSLIAAPAASIAIAGSGTGAVTLSGPTSALNAYLAIAQPAYLTASNANGTVTLTATLNDLGNSGSGGALSDMKTVSLNIDPRPDADLALALSSAPFFHGGGIAHVQLFLRNHGPDTVNGNALSFATSGNLTNVVWACIDTTPAICPTAAGSGPLNIGGLALPAGGVLQFQFDADVAAIPEIAAVASATLTPPGTLQDPTVGDHAVTRTAVVGIFRNGFQ